MKNQIFLFFIFILFACNSSPYISINGQKKIPQSVAVIFTEELENLKQRFPALSVFVSRGVMNREYHLIGERLTSSLYSNLLSIYEKVSLRNEIPPADEYDIVIKFNLHREKTGWMDASTDYKIEFQNEDSGFRDKASSIDITTVVEVLDGTNLNILKKKEITGKGNYLQKSPMEKHGRSATPTIAGLELNRRRFEKAVKDAMLQVNKKVIKFLLKIASD
jgi:hypothetical protein